MRERRYFWSSVPGKNLLLISLAAVAGFFLPGVFGGGILPALAAWQAAVLLGTSALFAAAVDFAEYGLFRAFSIS